MQTIAKYSHSLVQEARLQHQGGPVHHPRRLFELAMLSSSDSDNVSSRSTKCSPLLLQSKPLRIQSIVWHNICDQALNLICDGRHQRDL